ncbi:MAG: hypothetical protein IJ677_07760 [Alphaproteobacteria bacterium]|nr:hypothetical protein [Alphaproteobacteria bacterium]
MSIEETCRMVAIYGVSLIFASAWVLVQRLASAQIHYIKVKRRRLELELSEELSFREHKSELASYMHHELSEYDQIRDLCAQDNPKEEISHRSVIDFYKIFGRQLSLEELKTFTEFERYRRESIVNMSNLKIFPYILGEYTGTPMKYVYVVNDNKIDNNYYTEVGEKGRKNNWLEKCLKSGNNVNQKLRKLGNNVGDESSSARTCRVAHSAPRNDVVAVKSKKLGKNTDKNGGVKC